VTGTKPDSGRNGHSVLEIAQAAVSSADHERFSLMHGSIRADTGDLVLIRVVDIRQAELWADLAVGLLTPEHGRVSILGNDLSDLDTESGNWLRGRVGRVFSRGNWMDRLSLVDNILLSARHHSRNDDDDLRAQASALAASFGMPGIPLGMPHRFTRMDLQRAACVRAFLGDPLLVILEDPTYAAGGNLLKPLMDAIRAVRNRGAAVLWFSLASEIWRDRSIPATRRYRMAGDELMEVASR
jgi:phospholipid/cholesterol/gamma-HCH transport system ATP-binding protein